MAKSKGIGLSAEPGITPLMRREESERKARDDMHALRQAHEVRSDPQRHQAAIAQAKKEASIMADVAAMPGVTPAHKPGKKKA